ncbi:zinc finger domain-containing protein [Mesorhizobium sp. Root552]
MCDRCWRYSRTVRFQHEFGMPGAHAKTISVI